MPHCPNGQSAAVITHGRMPNGNPQCACTQCDRQCVHDSQHKRIGPDTHAWVDRLLLDQGALVGIVRVSGVALRWLPYSGKRTDPAQPRQVTVPGKQNGA